MKFAFIADHREAYPITLMCRVLGVSTSGFYAWQGRPVCQRQQANQHLLAEIQAIHERSRKTYGSRVSMLNCAREGSCVAVDVWPA